MKQILTHNIDYAKVAEGLGISEDLAVKFFNDGRQIGRLSEFILEQKSVAKRSSNENTPFDNIDVDNNKIEVRSITKSVSFASSKEVGYGRSVTEGGFQEKLDNVDSFVVIDFKDDPTKLKFFQVSSDDVKKWSDDGFIGKNKSVSRKKILKKIK